MSKAEDSLEELPDLNQELESAVIEDCKDEIPEKEPEREPNESKDSLFEDMKTLVSVLDEPAPVIENEIPKPPDEIELPELTEEKEVEAMEVDNPSNPYESNPQINVEDLKTAQQEMNEVDVAVCGGCHCVYHFVEDLIRHKPQCKKKSSFRNNIIEMKPQVWAFLLWKNAQGKITKHGMQVEESSWKLYQKWCKMPERIRQAWVAAGEAVMTYSTFGARQPDQPVVAPAPQLQTKVTKKPEKEVELIEDGDKPFILKKLVQRDHLGEIKEIRSTDERPEPKPTSLKEDIENIRNQLEGIEESQNIPPIQVQNGGTLREEEFVVEKIVSRRFNPKKKQYEYLLKWEGYPPEQNTWEPAENLETCQHLLKSFEESLAKQSYQKLVRAKKQAALELTTPGPSNIIGGRPVRSSKQKALSQVKQWCGSIKPDELDNDYEEEFMAKRIKTEPIDSGDESSIPAGSPGGRILYTKGGTSGIMKRVGRPIGRPPKAAVQVNGGDSTSANIAAVLGLDQEESGKMSPLAVLNQRAATTKVSDLSPINQQVLVENAKGVLRVDTTKVPNLSSGVYIMSNKSIVKLDSVTPSKVLALKESQLKQDGKPSPPSQPVSDQTITTTTSLGGGGQVVMVSGGVQKSGIVRKNPGILRGGQSASATGTQPAVRINAPGTKLQSGIIPRTPMSANPVRLRGGLSSRNGTQIRKTSEPGRGIGSRGRGGFRNGIQKKANNIPLIKEDLESKLKDLKSTGETDIFEDLPEVESSESDPGIPDDFPKDLPLPVPESPPRPLSLCPLTGKVLCKAEGENTPEPTPPTSPVKPQEVATVDELPAVIGLQQGSVETAKALFVDTSGNSETEGTVEQVVVKMSPKEAEVTEADEENMVTITGEDGLLYKVSNSDLGTLLGGEEGEQCVYVTDGDETVLALASQYQHQNITQVMTDEGETQYLEGEDGELVSLQQEGEEPGGQVVAQLVEAGEPVPGGLRKVVLLLPNGNLMMTEVDEEQYAALELDK